MKQAGGEFLSKDVLKAMPQGRRNPQALLPSQMPPTLAAPSRYPIPLSTPSNLESHVHTGHHCSVCPQDSAWCPADMPSLTGGLRHSLPMIEISLEASEQHPEYRGMGFVPASATATPCLSFPTER